MLNPVGINQWADDANFKPSLPDQFIMDPNDPFHFPCAMCAHREDEPAKACLNCRYFVH